MALFFGRNLSTQLLSQIQKRTSFVVTTKDIHPKYYKHLSKYRKYCHGFDLWEKLVNTIVVTNPEKNFVCNYVKIKWAVYYPNGKCFTCVTKTIANLATYSRKPENYNSTIIFEFDIMKNSSPINWNLCQTWLFHLLFGCLFCFDLIYSELSWECCESSRKEVLFWFWHGNKCEYLIEWGWVFHDVNLKNNGAIVIPRFSTICG
jgi:hypothetical protein